MLTPESGWGAAYNIELSSIARREKHAAEDMADVDAWLAGTKDLQTWQSGELPVPADRVLLTGDPCEAPVNIPNTGQAPDLPDDVVVESICVVDGGGDHGAATCSRSPGALRRDRAPPRRRPGDDGRGRPARRPGVGRGRRSHLDPLAGRGDLAETDAMVAELLAGTARWLPQFA